MLNISESFCEAVDQIVQSRIREIKYDKTVICTIIEANQSDKGFYTVQQDSMRFLAYSDSKEKYSEGDMVSVLVPEGDYARQKIIISKYKTVDEFTEVGSSFSLKNQFVAYANLDPIVEFVGIASSSNSNEDEKLVIQYASLSSYNSISDCTVIYIRGDFKTVNLTDYLYPSGDYGIIVKIYDSQDQKLLSSYKWGTKDFFGAPYAFSFPSSQEILLDISDLKEEHRGVRDYRIEVYLYQDGKFSPAKQVEGDDIFVKIKNFQIGYLKGEFVEKLTLNSETDPIFHLTNSNTIIPKITLRWDREEKTSEEEVIFKSDTSSFDFLNPNGFWNDNITNQQNVHISTITESGVYPIIRWYTERTGMANTQVQNDISLKLFNDKTWEECSAIDAYGEECTMPPLYQFELNQKTLTKKIAAAAAMVNIICENGKIKNYKIIKSYISQPLEFKQTQIEFINSWIDVNVDNSIPISYEKANNMTNNNIHIINLQDKGLDFSKDFVTQVLLTAGAGIEIKKDDRFQIICPYSEHIVNINFPSDSPEVEIRNMSAIALDYKDAQDDWYSSREVVFKYEPLPLIKAQGSGWLIIKYMIDELGGSEIKLYSTTNPVYNLIIERIE